jgi:hypothetical protein
MHEAILPYIRGLGRQAGRRLLYSFVTDQMKDNKNIYSDPTMNLRGIEKGKPLTFLLGRLICRRGLLGMNLEGWLRLHRYAK